MNEKRTLGHGPVRASALEAQRVEKGRVGEAQRATQTGKAPLRRAGHGGVDTLSPASSSWSEQERPRERLLRHGAGRLGEDELVALLLRTGHRGASAKAVARELLDAVDGLDGLQHAGFDELCRPGVGPAKGASILAALELGRRLAREDFLARPDLRRAGAAARYLLLRYGRRDQEVMGALYTDSRHRLLRERELFRGTLTRTSVEPRAILAQGIVAGAAGLVLFHTHPSGDPSPSAEDLVFTRRLHEACEIVGLELLDHLVLGVGGQYVSLRERGGW